MKDISSNLVYLRRSHNYTKAELAKAIGVSARDVDDWENGDAKPSADEMIMLSNLYKVSLDELIKERDDDDFDEDFDDDEDEDDKPKNKVISKLMKFPFPIFAVTAYLFCGFFFDNWYSSVTIFFTVPLYYSLLTCIDKKNFKLFAYPVLVTAVYYFLGSEFGLWHSYWLLYLTVPMFYALVPGKDEKKEKDKEDKDRDNDFDI